jgi:DNA-binding response OmpR family regulator
MLTQGTSSAAAKLHRMLEILSITPGEVLAGAEQSSHAAELIAQLRAISREAAPTPRDASLHLGELTIDFAGHEVRLSGFKVHLTHREFALLSFLAQHRGRVCRREQLMAQLWSDRRLTSDRTVDIHVYRLRRKLPQTPALIETIRNVGYILRVNGESA